MVTSLTKSSNFNVKSYLLTSQNSIYQLIVKLIKAFIKRQLKLIAEAKVRKGVKTKEQYLTQTYLSKLTIRILFKTLVLINKEYKFAKVTFPIITHAAKPLKPYNNNHCSLSQSHGLPYQYKIYTILTAEKHLHL